MSEGSSIGLFVVVGVLIFGFLAVLVIGLSPTLRGGVTRITDSLIGILQGGNSGLTPRVPVV